MFTATMPLAAQCLPIAFIVTTVYEILWTELRKKGCSLPLWKRSIFSAMLTDVDLGMCLSHFGGQTMALPSMWRSLVSKHCDTYAEVKKHAYYDEGFKVLALS